MFSNVAAKRTVLNVKWVCTNIFNLFFLLGKDYGTCAKFGTCAKSSTAKKLDRVQRQKQVCPLPYRFAHCPLLPRAML